jgi:two-component system response regulator YesN
MLSLLIVDDEPIIREGLRRIIDWEKIGFTVCGEASNGGEGLTMACRMKPDLIIVDIKMPVMDGLKMLEELRSQQLQSKAIILTAYSDFQYARKAIELGVESYVLKPIDEDELLGKVLKVREDILHEKKDRIVQDVSISLSRDRVLESLVLGEGGKEQAWKGNNLFGFGFPWKSYQVLILELEKADRDLTVIRSSIRSEAENYIQENNYGYVFNTENNLCVLLRDVSFETNSHAVRELQKKVLHSCGSTVTILVGLKTTNLAEVPSSYRHARKLAESRFILGHKRIIAARTSKPSETKETDISSYLDSLYDAVALNSMNRINNLLEEIRRRFIRSNCTEESVKISYTRLYVSVSNRFASDVESGKNMVVKGDVLGEIHKKTSLHDLHGYVKYLLMSLSDEYAKARYPEPIGRILNYIELNYAMDLKLDTLSSLFNYNRAYLGKLFKNNTGKYFNTYLDLVRIEKAKLLLKEGYKIYQVAEKVGFRDIDYFSAKFKKYVGVPPSSFKLKA